MEETRQWMRMKEASVHTRLSLSTIKAAVHDGRLPKYQRGDGTVILLRIEDVDAFAAGYLNQPAEEAANALDDPT